MRKNVTDLPNFIYIIIQATPHNPPAASPGKLAPRFRAFFLRYTKYICEKAPLSEPNFSQDLLLPNYAVLPSRFCRAADSRPYGFAGTFARQSTLAPERRFAGRSRTAQGCQPASVSRTAAGIGAASSSLKSKLTTTEASTSRATTWRLPPQSSSIFSSASFTRVRRRRQSS